MTRSLQRLQRLAEKETRYMINEVKAWKPDRLNVAIEEISRSLKGPNLSQIERLVLNEERKIMRAELSARAAGIEVKEIGG